MVDRIRFEEKSEGPGQVLDRRGMTAPSGTGGFLDRAGDAVADIGRDISDFFSEDNIENPFPKGTALNPDFEAFEEARTSPEKTTPSVSARHPRRPVEIFQRAVRIAETGPPDGDYTAIRGIVRGSARLLGAYGVPSDEWEGLAADAGMPGARWQDPKAQDAVTRHTFQRLADKFLDWRWVAMAWKAGEEGAGRAYVEPQVIDMKELVPLKGWVESVMQNAQEQILRSANPTEAASRELFKPHWDDIFQDVQSRGGYRNPEFTPGVPADTFEEVLRRRLYAMRERIRNLPEEGEMVSPAEVGVSEAGTGLPGIPTGRTGILGTPETTASAEQIQPAPGTRVPEDYVRRGRGQGVAIGQRTNRGEDQRNAGKPRRRLRNRTKAGGTGGIQE